MNLTKNKIQYLLTIDKLCNQSNQVRLVDICSSMSVSRASVHRMLGYLTKMGLIIKKNDYIFLSNDGKSLTNELMEVHMCLYTFFKTHFKLPREEAKLASFSLLGNLTRKSLFHLYQEINSNILY